MAFKKTCPLLDKECINAKCEMYHCKKQKCLIKLISKSLFVIEYRTTQIRDIFDCGDEDND